MMGKLLTVLPLISVLQYFDVFVDHLECIMHSSVGRYFRYHIFTDASSLFEAMKCCDKNYLLCLSRSMSRSMDNLDLGSSGQIVAQETAFGISMENGVKLVQVNILKLQSFQNTCQCYFQIFR